MARKTPGTPSTRNKKSTSPIETPAVQPASTPVVPEVRNEVRSDIRNNVTPINVVTVPKKTPVNLDEEIRLRAYEMFLERKGSAGDPALDWINAEKEVRARYAGQNPSAAAAAQGRG